MNKELQQAQDEFNQCKAGLQESKDLPDRALVILAKGLIHSYNKMKTLKQIEDGNEESK